MLHPFGDQEARKANLFCNDVIYFTVEGSKDIQSGTIIRVDSGAVKVILESDADGNDVIMEELDLNKITLYGKPERASYTFQEYSQQKSQKWIHILYSWGDVEEPVTVPSGTDAWTYAKGLAINEVATAQETMEGEVGVVCDQANGMIRLRYPDNTYCFYQISERKAPCQFIDGQDAIFLPGKIHGAEHQVYILYYNASASNGEGCWEIEILDAERILEAYKNVDGDAQAFFEELPGLFQGEWLSCSRSDLDFYAYAAAFTTADFIYDEDGTCIDEMEFLVDWAKALQNNK